MAQAQLMQNADPLVNPTQGSNQGFGLAHVNSNLNDYKYRADVARHNQALSTQQNSTTAVSPPKAQLSALNNAASTGYNGLTNANTQSAALTGNAMNYNSSSLNGGNQVLQSTNTTGQNTLQSSVDAANTTRQDAMNFLGIGDNNMSAEQVNNYVENQPGYQFRMDQGMKALETRLGQRGISASGREKLNMMQYAQGFASEEYNKIASNLFTFLGINQGAVTQQATMQQQLGQDMAANNVQYANMNTQLTANQISGINQNASAQASLAANQMNAQNTAYNAQLAAQTALQEKATPTPRVPLGTQVTPALAGTTNGAMY